MKKIFFLYFFWSFSLFSSEKNKSLIMTSIQLENGQHVIMGERFSELKKYIKKHQRDYKVLSDAEVGTIFIPLLNDDLDKELQYAQDAYFSLKLDDCLEILEGRRDSGALLWKTVAYFSHHQWEESRHMILSLIMLDPDFKPSPKDFPPKFLSFFEESRKHFMKGHFLEKKRMVPLVDVLTKMSEQAWRRRFWTLMEKMKLDQLILVKSETVGWNEKLIFFAFKHDEKNSFIQKEIELVGAPNWDQVGKILVNTMFSQ